MLVDTQKLVDTTKMVKALGKYGLFCFGVFALSTMIKIIKTLVFSLFVRVALVRLTQNNAKK